MDDARRMTALVVSRKKGVFSLVYSTCGHVYVMINLKKKQQGRKRSRAKAYERLSLEIFGYSPPSLCDSFLKVLLNWLTNTISPSL
jgi:hypothetical protein